MTRMELMHKQLCIRQSGCAFATCVRDVHFVVVVLQLDKHTSFVVAIYRRPQFGSQPDCVQILGHPQYNHVVFLCCRLYSLRSDQFAVWRWWDLEWLVANLR